LAEFVDSGRRNFGKRNSVKKEILRERVFRSEERRIREAEKRWGSRGVGVGWGLARAGRRRRSVREKRKKGSSQK
jgi:hypothetical protein